ncbi:acetyl-CoA decarbonylase/synthase complex subunit delta [Methanocaldococcus villosus KIN24-T80]|uniref:Acetyl-CoA decarbonylase/synthase complex subunit delta n=2 Tax=Methanocaldococcus villosus TaxID=667126 RepID=N6VSF5_9EURY|nr:acetyl-CoA decarbonylase/synthase complex subunit delta [Methanocaldococcus villosus KIN24-T80]
MLKDIIKILEKVGKIEIENVKITAEEIIINIPQSPPITIPQTPAIKQSLAEEGLIEPPEVDFELPIEKYSGRIREVQFGKPKSEGGRGKVVKIGGQTSLYRFEAPYPNPPAITFDIFDMPMPGLPKPIREFFEDVMEDPCDWARKCVKEFGADMITIHHISTDPKIKDKSPKEAAKLMEDLMQAVDVPFVIGGSGNPEKDPHVLAACAEVCEGDRCLLASANLELDYRKIVEAAMKYDHNVLAWSIMDPNMAKELNRKLIEAGLDPNRIVMDPTTCALGYGIEFSINAITRLRIEGLKGNELCNMPMSSGTTNAIGAREAWMKNPEWGDRRYRLPLWEITTGITMLMSGVDLFMMLNPIAVRILKDIGRKLTTKPKKIMADYDWIYR